MSELDLYDYHLPEELIAREPAREREGARLLVVGRGTGHVEHRTVRDLPELLRAGDLLVLNDTRVLPARLVGYRAATGGRWEGLFLKAHGPGVWEVIGQTRGKLVPGEELVVPAVNLVGDVRLEANGSSKVAEAPSPPAPLPRVQGRGEPDISTGSDVAEAPEGPTSPSNEYRSAGAISTDNRQLTTDNCSLRLTLLERLEDGGWLVRPSVDRSHVEVLEQFGQIPLPPYIERDSPTAADRERYQTLHARQPGSVAAPTAGLHFTPELLAACRDRGIHDAYVTLHVGLGTFRPISVDRLADHVMHSEWCEVSAETVRRVEAARAAGGRVVAVGTTSVRTLESASHAGRLTPFSGETRLFIQPPYSFQSVDVILTNFHLPKSTLLVLMSAFAGRDLLLRAYSEAITQRYRFYSYGDAMLVL